MYKKILVVLHDSILPHMSKPTLMIDFLTAAYEVGKLYFSAIRANHCDCMRGLQLSQRCLFDVILFV